MPTLFIASSVEDAALLDMLETALTGSVTVLKWVEGRAALDRNVLEWLVDEANRSDFGLFVLSPDARWGGQPNGNVLLEFGLFAGDLGPRRCFVLKERSLELPSDLQGRIVAEYDAAEFARRKAAALDEACAKILRALAAGQNTLIDQIRGLWLETKDVTEAKFEGRYTLVEFDVIGGDPKVRGRSYDGAGEARVEWPHSVDQCLVAKDQIFHTFDARFGATQLGTALGVTRFAFDEDRLRGRGHYVVHGSRQIRQGEVPFQLHKVTAERLAEAQLEAPLSLTDRDRCAAFVRHLIQPQRTKRRARTRSRR